MADANSFLGMNSNRSSRRAGAFSLVELLCVIAIIGLLAALLLPVLNQSEARAKRIGCENNLRQAGIAFQIFTHDHDGKFPMSVSMNEGGAAEFVQNGYAVGGEFYFSFRQFQVLSNELSMPSILTCPTDTRFPATNFGALQNSNLSYFIGVKAEFSKPDSILAGDRNLTANSLPNPSILHIEAGNPLRWTWGLHQFKGNILFAGGQVEEWNNAALVGAGQSTSWSRFIHAHRPSQPQCSRSHFCWFPELFRCQSRRCNAATSIGRTSLSTGSNLSNGNPDHSAGESGKRISRQPGQIQPEDTQPTQVTKPAACSQE